MFNASLDRTYFGQADGIGTGAGTGDAPMLRVLGHAATKLPEKLRTHREIVPHLIEKVILPKSGTPRGVGHRVVHGGRDFSAPVRVGADVKARIGALASLAPAHQPHNLAGIEAAEAALPGAIQVACFDTAFHRTIPSHRQEMPLPRRYAEEGLIRYGFHGLSYEHIFSRLPDVLGARAKGRVVICHLGNGCSIAGLVDGTCQYTSMGFTPLDGLMMGQRPGRLDPGAVLWLVEREGGDTNKVRMLLNKESGLAGVSGISADMRALLSDKSERAAFAVRMFCDRLAQEIGATAAAIGGLDALVFTGGIGENAAPVRAAVLDALSWLGFVVDAEANQSSRETITTKTSQRSGHVIATNEELVIARAVVSVCSGE